MNPRWLVRLYPRAWRERYGEELIALLDVTPADSRAVRDVVLGAAGEWVHLGVGAAPPVLLALRTLLGYYCATQLIWWGVSAVEFLEMPPASARAWTPEGLMLSAVIQARAAAVCAIVVFGLGWIALGAYPTTVRRWVLDLMPAIALIAMIFTVRGLEGAGIGPSRDLAEAYFGDWVTLSVCAHMWTMNWAIPMVRRWTDEPESWLPFMSKPRS
jgi:hypothetical protein